jgi:hypothetical protein
MRNEAGMIHARTRQKRFAQVADFVCLFDCLFTVFSPRHRCCYFPDKSSLRKKAAFGSPDSQCEETVYHGGDVHCVNNEGAERDGVVFELLSSLRWTFE